MYLRVEKTRISGDIDHKQSVLSHILIKVLKASRKKKKDQITYRTRELNCQRLLNSNIQSKVTMEHYFHETAEGKKASQKFYIKLVFQ